MDVQFVAEAEPAKAPNRTRRWVWRAHIALGIGMYLALYLHQTSFIIHQSPGFEIFFVLRALILSLCFPYMAALLFNFIRRYFRKQATPLRPSLVVFVILFWLTMLPVANGLMRSSFLPY